jgi:hypothetical protein
MVGAVATSTGNDEVNGWVVFLGSGVLLGRAIFRPRHVFGPEERGSARLNRIRAVLGLLVGSLIWTVYSTEPPLRAVSGSAAMWVFAAALSIPPYLLMVAVMVGASRERRLTLRRMARGPLLSMLLAVLVVSALYLVSRPDHGFLRPDRVDSMPGMVKPFFIYAGLQVMLCAFTSTYYIWVHAYRAIDGHPLLRPLVTPLLAWVGAYCALGFGIAEASGVPAPVAWVSSIGGAVMVTVLAVLEYVRTSRYLGITFRTATPAAVTANN